MTAVSAERDAVIRGIRGSNLFDVRLAGVGSPAAAANTATILSSEDYCLVISAGIGGGFIGQAELGSIVIANEIIAADLGAETAEGFCSVDELGFGSSRVQVDSTLVTQLEEALHHTGLSVHTGPVLTVSTVTGTSESAMELQKRVPGATAEAMEGYGVAIAAQIHNIPILEVRTISNAVGPRDRAAWKMKEAFEALEAASSILLEVLT
ncbi:futalosine hydrolase [Paenibacillus crassostreae]|uniref:Futalosine hydrolase n=2 Tax=Paenibacillus crassostreae TaxID=1763538 RepID=A0A167G4C2_9BACL|nr:futalosine hydrolase [Paenibacillus crassostreae]OAB77201.1 futalosine hydrolase [Paenibacillus crassostreae]